MKQVEVEQKNYQMPPQDGFSIAHFLTVIDIERSARFYETVFGGRILSSGDGKGAPGYIQIANTWLIVPSQSLTFRQPKIRNNAARKSRAARMIASSMPLIVTPRFPAAASGENVSRR